MSTPARPTRPAPTVLPVRFAGSRTGEGPLTWGQRAIWHAIGRTAPNDHYFNLARVLPLAERGAGVPEERFTAAVAALVARHEALRTRLDVADGEPRQRLHDTGRLDVAVADEPDSDRTGRAAAELLARLAGTRFDYRGEWPVRIGAVRSGGLVTHAVLALCHLAADGHGAELLVRDLRLLIRRGAAGRPCTDTPLDLAREQHGPAGRRRGEAALARWEAAFRRMPPTMFPRPVAEPRSPRFWTGRLVSRALGRATDTLAAAHGVSGSTVLLAGCAVLVAADQGHPLATVLPIAGNRAVRDHRELVGTLSQDALFVLDLPPDARTTFPDLLPVAWRAALAGYRAAAYHPSAWEELRERVGRERGTEVHPYCCFNDMRLVDRPLPDGPPATAEELAAARTESTLDFPATQELVACRYLD
ncbi:condensation domain-containing protein [Kitasatospora hibisci]|uniref:condensation domain-containing protein n=1 Tax=Kitasatospora hibisci TaxID=3369522 RepID=UPI003754E1A9